MSNLNSKFIVFFSKPIVGIIGTFASIISLILAVYFFTANQKNRLLTFYQHPVEVSVLKTDQTSQFDITIDGKKIESDITAIQIAVWNQGSLPIKNSNILKEIIITPTSNIEILETRVIKESRDVVDLNVDKSRLEMGKIGLNWRILEKNDGGIIQIVYAGPNDVNFEFEGVIEGQQKLNKISYPNDIKTPIEQYRIQNDEIKSGGFISLGMGILMFFMILLVNRKTTRMKKEISRLNPNYISRSSEIIDQTIKLSGWVLIPVMIGISVYLLFFKMVSGPPFGF